MCSRIFFAVLTGLAAFVGAWFLLMSTLTGERYVSALEITPLAAVAGLLATGLTLLLMTPRRRAGAAQPAQRARQLTDAHVQLAFADPPPAAVTRPQPASIPEDDAAHWLKQDGRRKVWPGADTPATLAVSVIIKGRRAIRYTSATGEVHTMFVE